MSERMIGKTNLHHHPSSIPFSSNHSSLSPCRFTFPSQPATPPFIKISISSCIRQTCSSTSLRHDGENDEKVEPLSSLHLQPISGEDQFDLVLDEAQQSKDAVVVVWTANWCRKCIYLKPKLEKLAADYYPRLRFYSVDVNTVSHKLVARAGVTKMPTIQLWKDSKKQAEVIGSHKAYLVINEIQEMIENEFTT
ncbi:thioredoxin-like 3-2, chloroplastic [Lotus japonicus]|uniref:thioredoxin-like 3-2, chloroplastic n=1 Tax=Lotus japonicus TaxID=34305 RepID=UPI00258E8A49|nr:thioredoxin-like 3-2, chloroplastic [Lotus japonicus]